MKRASFFKLNNGTKADLPFTDKEYANRLASLRKIISQNNLGSLSEEGMMVHERHKYNWTR